MSAFFKGDNSMVSIQGEIPQHSETVIDKAELAQLRANDARYRWIVRDNRRTFMVPKEESRESINAAIDAAIAAQRGEKK